MSKMSELDAELREAGVGPEGVDLETIVPVTWMHFNANNEVMVKLTDEGERILAEHYGGTMPSFYQGYIDKDGWWKFQLHNLAHIFGPYLYNGNPKLPFEMGMRVCLG